MSEALTELTAKLKKIIYKSSNGWCVFAFEEEDGTAVKATGIFDLTEGQSYTLTGQFVTKPKYGMTFELYDAVNSSWNPKTPEGMEQFLSKNVKGIGAKMARAIVRAFGDQTFNVLDTEPERLLDIKGITQKKLNVIVDTYNANTKYRKMFVSLAPYGITPGLIHKITDKYQEQAYNIVSNNPYKLYEDIPGIGFLTADSIAAKMGLPPDSPKRIRAAILFALEEASVEGHVYLDRLSLVNEIEKRTKIRNILGFGDYLDSLAKDRKIIETTDLKVYLSRLFYAEKHCAENILRLLNAKSKNNFDASPLIAEIEAELRKENPHFTNFDMLQRQAVINAADSTVSILTGGPGTGKTSCIIGMIKALQKHNKNISIVQVAPTGKAAKRMTQQTGLLSSTIHRMLLSSEGEESKGEFLDGDVFIMDESSMVDISLANSFFSYIKTGAKLIIIGDTDQLPSIGPGTVLSDIIESRTVPTVYLTKIYRQTGECGIVTTAYNLKTGSKTIVSDNSMRFIDAKDDNEAFSLTMELYEYLLKHGYTTSDIAILTPFRKKRLISSEEINQYISDRFNPNTEAFDYAPKPFKVGDRVIHTKNDYHLEYYLTDRGTPQPGDECDGEGVFNGETGKITSVRNENASVNGEPEAILTVEFDDGKTVFYTTDNVNELDLSYSMTIHKSQGSEYPVVICPVLMSQSYFLQRNLIYTAITRASKHCYLIGERRAYYVAQGKVEASKRKTCLMMELISNGNYNTVKDYSDPQMSLDLQ